MKAMLAGFAATAVIAVAACYILGGLGYSSQDRMSGDAVRLDDAAQ